MPRNPQLKVGEVWCVLVQVSNRAAPPHCCRVEPLDTAEADQVTDSEKFYHERKNSPPSTPPTRHPPHLRVRCQSSPERPHVNPSTAIIIGLHLHLSRSRGPALSLGIATASGCKFSFINSRITHLSVMWKRPPWSWSPGRRVCAADGSTVTCRRADPVLSA